jgi:hypothetical protein
MDPRQKLTFFTQRKQPANSVITNSPSESPRLASLVGPGATTDLLHNMHDFNGLDPRFIEENDTGNSFHSKPGQRLSDSRDNCFDRSPISTSGALATPDVLRCARNPRRLSVLARRKTKTRLAGKNYILGPSVFRLSRQYDWSNMLATVAHDHLKSLAAFTNETAHLAVRVGRSALFIDHASSTHVIAVPGLRNMR